VRLLVVALLVAAVLPVPATGDPRDEPLARELCAPGVRHHGAAIDLDVRGAGIHDVFRLLADAGRINLVIPDDVTGTVTLHLVHVAWDAAACAIAGVHRLRIDVEGNILVVARRAPGGR
jgi:type IV pilus assembly protein PilQ